jgi:hypothetical protein
VVESACVEAGFTPQIRTGNWHVNVVAEPVAEATVSDGSSDNVGGYEHVGSRDGGEQATSGHRQEIWSSAHTSVVARRPRRTERRCLSATRACRHPAAIRGAKRVSRDATGRALNRKVPVRRVADPFGTQRVVCSIWSVRTWLHPFCHTISASLSMTWSLALEALGAHAGAHDDPPLVRRAHCRRL